MFTSIPDWFPMKKQANPQGISKKMFLPVLLAHAACCGGILLWPVVGSATITALGGFMDSLALQLVGLILLAAGFTVFWRRMKVNQQSRSQITNTLKPPESHPEGEAS